MGNCKLLPWIILGNQIIQEARAMPKGGMGHTVGVGPHRWRWGHGLDRVFCPRTVWDREARAMPCLGQIAAMRLSLSQ